MGNELKENPQVKSRKSIWNAYKIQEKITTNTQKKNCTPLES